MYQRATQVGAKLSNDEELSHHPAHISDSALNLVFGRNFSLGGTSVRRKLGPVSGLWLRCRFESEGAQ